MNEPNNQAMEVFNNVKLVRSLLKSRTVSSSYSTSTHTCEFASRRTFFNWKLPLDKQKHTFFFPFCPKASREREKKLAEQTEPI